MPNQRIVLTGATGLLGSQLVERLAKRGDHVVALVRDVERARRQAPGAAEYVRWSSSDRDGEWRSRIDGADAVVNLAGSPIAARWSDESKKKMYSSRIDGTRSIVDAIEGATNRPRVLVNASAVGYYGIDAPNPTPESAPPGNDFLARLCVDWEKEAMRAESLGVRTVCVRTGIVLDPKGGALARLLLPFKLFVGGPIGSGKQAFPWVHVEDEISIFLWALDNPEVHGAINAAAPGIVDNKEFSSALGRALHRPAILPTPAFALNLVLGEGVVIVTGGQRVVPQRATELGYRFRFPELDGALKDLL